MANKKQKLVEQFKKAFRSYLIDSDNNIKWSLQTQLWKILLDFGVTTDEIYSIMGECQKEVDAL